MIISFCGLDGTGKTTQAKQLVQHLIEQGDRCAYHHIIRNSVYYFILHKIVGRISPRSKTVCEKGLRQKNGSSFRPLFFIKELFLLLELVLFNLRYAGYKGNPRKHIICDRYFYDEAVQLENLRGKKCLFSRLYEMLIIKPDIIYYMDIPPEVAFKRSEDDYEMEFFIRKANVYKVYMQDKRAVKINSMGIEKTRELIFSHWDSIRRYGNPRSKR